MSELVIAGRADVPAMLEEQKELARLFSGSGLMPTALRGKPENVLVIMFHARALDIPMMQAFNHVHVIDGKPGMSAQLMTALVQREGHRLRVTKSDMDHATVEIIRKDDEDYTHTVTFTWDDVPGILREKANWKNYRKDLLVARALSRGTRRACADVVMGMGYTKDELEDQREIEAPVTVQKTSARAAALRATVEEPAAPVVDDEIADAEVVDESPTPDPEVAHPEQAEAGPVVDETTGLITEPVQPEPTLDATVDNEPDDDSIPLDAVRKAVTTAMLRSGLTVEDIEARCMEVNGTLYNQTPTDVLKSLMEARAAEAKQERAAKADEEPAVEDNP